MIGSLSWTAPYSSTPSPLAFFCYSRILGKAISLNANGRRHTLDNLSCPIVTTGTSKCFGGRQQTLSGAPGEFLFCSSSGHVGYLPGSFAGRRGLEPRHENAPWVIFRWRPTSKLFVKAADRKGRLSPPIRPPRRMERQHCASRPPGISTILAPLEPRTTRFLMTPSGVKVSTSNLPWTTLRSSHLPIRWRCGRT